MNAEELVRQDSLSTAPYGQVLNGEICHKLELAFVAIWLDCQDESVQAQAAITACKAISQLRHAFNNKSN